MAYKGLVVQVDGTRTDFEFNAREDARIEEFPEVSFVVTTVDGRNLFFPYRRVSIINLPAWPKEESKVRPGSRDEGDRAGRLHLYEDEDDYYHSSYPPERRR